MSTDGLLGVSCNGTIKKTLATPIFQISDVAKGASDTFNELQAGTPICELTLNRFKANSDTDLSWAA